MEDLHFKHALEKNTQIYVHLVVTMYLYYIYIYACCTKTYHICILNVPIIIHYIISYISHMHIYSNMYHPAFLQKPHNLPLQGSYHTSVFLVWPSCRKLCRLNRCDPFLRLLAGVMSLRGLGPPPWLPCKILKK